MDNKIINIANNWIYQSNHLIEASFSLTTLESKIVLLLSSMVKKSDTEFEEYTFRVKDLVKIFGLKYSTSIYKEIDKTTTSLMEKIIIARDVDNTKNFKKYHIIETCSYNNGLLKLKIGQDMKAFYLLLSQRYTKFQIHNILELKSSYSFRIYPLLKQYMEIGTRKIKIEDLKRMLELEHVTYDYMKRNVITKSQKEINEKTDIKFTFSEIKEGRKIVALIFDIIKNEQQIINLEYRPETKDSTLNKKNNYGYPKGVVVPRYAQFDQRNYTDEEIESLYTIGGKIIK